MADYRLYTFLKLCELMNYRKTAEALNMTQPAVTQHIHYLEEEYGCRLFTYENRVLRKTEHCAELERYALSLLFNEKAFLERLHRPAAMRLAIGATKTIGDYTIGDRILRLLKRDDVELELIIDNTENLLARLNALQLDVLLIEGFIDKNSYGHELIHEEELVGICAPGHPFANRTVSLEELLQQPIILRESGSGTRAVLEHFLQEHGFSESSFRKKAQISSFKLIEQAVEENCGVSFVYESIRKSNPHVASFRLREGRIFHEFNYVFLKNTHVEQTLSLLRGDD